MRLQKLHAEEVLLPGRHNYDKLKRSQPFEINPNLSEFWKRDVPGAHAVPPLVEIQERSLQLESKIAQFRLNLVYQFTQHLRIVKHLLTRTNIIFLTKLKLKRNNHTHC